MYNTKWIKILTGSNLPQLILNLQINRGQFQEFEQQLDQMRHKSG